MGRGIKARVDHGEEGKRGAVEEAVGELEAEVRIVRTCDKFVGVRWGKGEVRIEEMGGRVWNAN